ncbi:MAG: hypothetical protein SNJ69_06735 [Chloroflexaceae bacterium]
MSDLDWLDNQPPLVLLQLARVPAHWLQRFGEAGRAAQRWGLVAEQLAAFRRDLPLAHVDPLAVLERGVAEQAPAEAPAERASRSPGGWPAREDVECSAGATGPRTRPPSAASPPRHTSLQDVAHERGAHSSETSPSARRVSTPAAIGEPPPPAASRASAWAVMPKGERPLPPAAPRLPTARLAALAGSVETWERAGERRVAGPAALEGQGVQRLAPGGGRPAAVRERPPVLAERQPRLAGRAASLAPEAQARALATPVGGPGLTPELLARALLTGSAGEQRGAAAHGPGAALQGERISAAAPGPGPARAGERGGPGGGTEQLPWGGADIDQRPLPLPFAGRATAHALPSMALLQTLLARYEAGGGAPAERQYPPRNGSPVGREAGQPPEPAAGSAPLAAVGRQTDSGTHGPALAPAAAAHALSPGVAAGPVVQNTFNVTVHTGQSADEPDDELAERITRILVEQARRYGIDV